MARLSQEEIFGPVLAVIKAKDYDDALAIANNTEYGLTGAVYTTSEEKIERAKREFHVGQSVHQSQVHRRGGGRESVRRLQYVGHGFEGGRHGLPVPVQPGQIDRPEAVISLNIVRQADSQSAAGSRPVRHNGSADRAHRAAVYL